MQESLQYKKDQLEKALAKVTKLRKVEPNRTDLKYEAVALTEGIRMLNEHLRNSQRYSDYCEGLKRPSVQEGGNQIYGTTGQIRLASMDMQPDNAFVNPMFSAQQAISSGYLIDPVKVNNGPGSSSDEECHNPKHKELELYLMSTGGTIRPSLLKFPDSVVAPSSTPASAFPSRPVQRPRRGSPLGLGETTDDDGRSFNVSPEQASNPIRVQNNPIARQPGPNDTPYFDSDSNPSSPDLSPNLSPAPPPSRNFSYTGSQPRISP